MGVSRWPLVAMLTLAAHTPSPGWNPLMGIPANTRSRPLVYTLKVVAVFTVAGRRHACLITRQSSIILLSWGCTASGKPKRDGGPCEISSRSSPESSRRCMPLEAHDLCTTGMDARTVVEWRWSQPRPAAARCRPAAQPASGRDPWSDIWWHRPHDLFLVVGDYLIREGIIPMRWLAVKGKIA
jgi:hypothetical protein